MRPEVVLGRVLGLEPNAITDATSSATVAEWDSMAHITLIVELETTYNVGFSVEETLLLKDCASIKRILTSKGARW
jgi:acyl carrier protein